MRSGFTLLELSIVLVIIGLIIGGITVGADMIRSAELGSVVSDIQKYQTSINTFRLKYSAVPGDMKNAEAYWGTDASSCPQGGGIGTCNGDGNGLIEHSTASTSYEGYRAWQHLSLANTISGAYTGIQGSSDAIILGTNTPETRITGGGFSFLTSASGWHGYYKNLLQIGSIDPVASSYTRGSLLTPAEANTIDEKIDDGIPNKGKIIAYGGDGNWTDCTTSGYSAYDLANSDIKCIIALKLQ